MTADEFLNNLAVRSGYIVSSASLSPTEIAMARAENRFYVDANGLGYAWMPVNVEWNRAAAWFKKWIIEKKRDFIDPDMYQQMLKEIDAAQSDPVDLRA